MPAQLKPIGFHRINAKSLTVGVVRWSQNNTHHYFRVLADVEAHFLNLNKVNF